MYVNTLSFVIPINIILYKSRRIEGDNNTLVPDIDLDIIHLIDGAGMHIV